MKAVVWHGKEDIRVEQVPDPKITQATDAIVRITSTAICGSDLHLFSKLSPVMKEGDIIGHEPMGVVEEVGPGVTNIAPGDRVVVPFNISCGNCFFCDKQLYSQCETTQNQNVGKGATLFGYTHLYGAVPGGQAEYLRVPQAHFGPIKVPHGPPEQRFLFLSDVLPTSWQAVRYASVRAGDTIGVWGLGPIGQMSARIARHLGADRVIGVDFLPERLNMARRHGVETIDLEEADNITEAVLDMTKGYGVDAVIDAVGMEADGSLIDSILTTFKIHADKLAALHQSMSVIRRGGTLSLSGVYTGPVHNFPLGDLFDKQITIRMGQANVKAWIDEILPLLNEDDPLGTDDLATHFLPLEQAAHGYEIFQKKKEKAIKVILQP